MPTACENNKNSKKQIWNLSSPVHPQTLAPEAVIVIAAATAITAPGIPGLGRSATPMGASCGSTQSEAAIVARKSEGCGSAQGRRIHAPPSRRLSPCADTTCPRGCRLRHVPIGKWRKEEEGKVEEGEKEIEMETKLLRRKEKEEVDRLMGKWGGKMYFCMRPLKRSVWKHKSNFASGQS